MISASDSYMRKRLLSAPPLKCTRFLFVGSKVNSLSMILDFSPKRCKFTTFFSKSKILGALFLGFAAKLVKNYENANESYLKRINKRNLVSNQKTLIQKCQRDLHKHQFLCTFARNFYDKPQRHIATIGQTLLFCRQQHPIGKPAGAKRQNEHHTPNRRYIGRQSC